MLRLTASDFPSLQQRGYALVNADDEAEWEAKSHFGPIACGCT